MSLPNGGSGLLIKINIAICVAPLIMSHYLTSYEVVLTYCSKLEQYVESVDVKRRRKYSDAFKRSTVDHVTETQDNNSESN